MAGAGGIGPLGWLSAAGRAGRSRRFKRYGKVHRAIKGWFAMEAAALWDCLIGFQNRAGIRGHWLEIGFPASPLSRSAVRGLPARLAVTARHRLGERRRPLRAPRRR